MRFQRVKKYCVRALLVTFAVSGVVGASSAPVNSEDAPLSVAVGVYAPPAPANGSAISRYVHLAGAHPAIIMWYQTWGEQYHAWSNRLANQVRAAGAIPMITWDPCNRSCANPDRAYKLTNITNGRFDGYIRRWALAAKAWGHSFFLRFAHEMNGGWYPWGTKPGNKEGNTPSDYVNAWRHVHNLFAHLHVTNPIWVWAPNEVHGSSVPLALDYPGDQYVDWVGLSAFNRGEPKARWRSFSAMIWKAYKQIAVLTTKPMMIAETASTEHGGNKASWIWWTFRRYLPRLFPRVRAVIWFDHNKETDWAINSSIARSSWSGCMPNQWVYWTWI